MTFRLARGWLALPLLSILGACAPPALVAPAALAGVGFTLAVAPPPAHLAAPLVQAAAVGPPVVVAPVASALPMSLPTSAPVATGVGSSGGGGSAVAPTFPSYFLLPDGAASGAVAVPAGTAGQFSLIAVGRVASSLVLDGHEGVTQTHPLTDSPSEPYANTATVTGTLAPAQTGATVKFVASDRSTFTATQSVANLPFSLAVPVSNNAQGLVVATDTQPRPDMAFAAVTVYPGATLDVGSLSLVPPVGDQPAPPTPPGAMTINGAELRVADAGGPGLDLAVVGSVTGALPAYALPGIAWLLAYRAIDPTGTQTSEVVGPPGQVPAFLVPPNLSGLASPVTAGQTLSWPAVAGATLYTLQLLQDGQPAPPLWQGATARPSIVLPAPLQLSGRLQLHVDAWDAQGVSIYSVASLTAALRQLRLPLDPLATAGRHCGTVRQF